MKYKFDSHNVGSLGISNESVQNSYRKQYTNIFETQCQNYRSNRRYSDPPRNNIGEIIVVFVDDPFKDYLITEFETGFVGNFEHTVPEGFCIQLSAVNNTQCVHKLRQ